MFVFYFLFFLSVKSFEFIELSKLTGFEKDQYYLKQSELLLWPNDDYCIISSEGVCNNFDFQDTCKNFSKPSDYLYHKLGIL